MTLALTLRNRDDALRSIAGRSVTEGPPDMLVDALIAAQLRAGCEIDAAREGRGLHTTRLVEAVSRNIVALMDTGVDARARVHAILDKLGRTGDLHKLAGGYWQATPERLVTHPHGYAFLLGTASARVDAVADGAVRYVDKVSSDVARQSLDDWLGREDRIDVWMANALRVYAARLQTSGVGADNLELYAPDAARQWDRASWRDANQMELSGAELRLCRASADKAAIYQRPYFLGEFAKEAGEVRLLRAVQVAHNHARRFRFGFDAVFSVPRRVRCQRTDDLTHMTIAKDLPVEEERVLSLGWNSGDGQSPALRRMTFPARSMPFVAHAFGRLGMILEGGT